MKGFSSYVKFVLCSFVSSLAAILLVFGLGSCIDDRYDLDKLDTTMTLVPGVTATVNKTVSITPTRSGSDIVYTTTPAKANVSLTRVKNIVKETDKFQITALVTNTSKVSLAGTVTFKCKGETTITCVCDDVVEPNSVTPVVANFVVNGSVLDIESATFNLHTIGEDPNLSESSIQVKITQFVFPEGITLK